MPCKGAYGIFDASLVNVSQDEDSTPKECRIPDPKLSEQYITDMIGTRSRDILRSTVKSLLAHLNHKRE